MNDQEVIDNLEMLTDLELFEADEDIAVIEELDDVGVNAVQEKK